MDIAMPIMDGYECTQKIRELEVETQASEHSFILGLTAHSTE